MNHSAEWILSKSIETWQRIRFSRLARHVRVSETTITENFIFDFWMAARTSSYSFRLYEARNERVNGNDFELILETVFGPVKFAIQAKIIKVDDRYTTLPHKAKTAVLDQVDLLINYADEHSAMPLYLFYNYTQNRPASNKVKARYKEPHIEYLGMSAALATDIKSEYIDQGVIPDFEELHLNTYAGTMPFYYLFLDDMEGLKSMGVLNDPNPQFPAFDDYQDWEMLAGPASIGGILESPVANLRKQAEETFSPQFRLVISLTKQIAGIYAME